MKKTLLLAAALVFGGIPLLAQPVTTIAPGCLSYHSLFLKSDGSLWGMGDLNGTNVPMQIVSSNVTAIAVGGAHSLFVKSDGSLWAMGSDTYGQLGDGRTLPLDKPNPEEIVASNVTAVAAGRYYSLFLKNDGSLWAMGQNLSGQLGDGTYGGVQGYASRPEEIVATSVVAIAAGEYHSLFLKSDGSLWAMGDRSFGELGDGTNSVVFSGTPQQVLRTNLPEQIVSGNVVAVAAGQMHSLFLKCDGSLWAMGDNYYGQLGDGLGGIVVSEAGADVITNVPEQIIASNVTAIAAGADHSLFVKNDGSLWDTGLNSSGQLGKGSTSGSAGYYFNTNFVPALIVPSGVTAVAAGCEHSLFLKNDGSLWGMGNSQYGQLGDGTYSLTDIPEQILGPYNQISGRLTSSTNILLSFVGIANANYALDWSSSLSPPNWIPQATNAAGSFGALIFTNTPDAAANNFWRIRAVQ